ncbi:MAG TPA: hypothetical protein PLZ55_11920 [bacterium]|nr:hypothetical protein [bacterium]
MAIQRTIFTEESISCHSRLDPQLHGESGGDGVILRDVLENFIDFALLGTGCIAVADIDDPGLIVSLDPPCAAHLLEDSQVGQGHGSAKTWGEDGQIPHLR